jgi:ribosomal protein S18 acetylase RimI-like enzyme
MSSWECSFHNRDNSGTRFGLVDLFGSRKRRRHLKSQEQQGESSSSACHIRTNASTDNNEDFFTFRMEHREGGAISQHYGEERILIFKSDRPGAIAKIIYSSSPAENEDSEEEEADASGETTDIDNERELDMMAQAKVHVLSVKEDYRGYDLGGLLFSEAMASLRHRYCDDRRKSTGIQPHYSHMSSVRCQLDAEEDIRRHDKLIGFYEQLGCSVKPKAKITYLNNNDGNTYRKIPMQVALKARPEKLKDSVATSLMDRKQGFLPVVLLEAPGKRVGVPSSSSRSNPAAARVDWLVVETGEGLLEFHTTKGAILFVKPDGQYYTASEDDETSCSHEDNNCSKFLLLRVSDARQRVLQGEVDADSDDDYSSTSIEARQKELWMIQSTRGSFLNFDPVSHSLTGSLQPSFWQANDHTLSLTCTCDTPPRRQHYRRMWAKQTVTYVNTMRERYLGFNLEHMSLKKALDLAHTLPANPYSMEPGVSTPSLRTLCVSAYISYITPQIYICACVDLSNTILYFYHVLVSNR